MPTVRGQKKGELFDRFPAGLEQDDFDFDGTILAGIGRGRAEGGRFGFDLVRQGFLLGEPVVIGRAQHCFQRLVHRGLPPIQGKWTIRWVFLLLRVEEDGSVIAYRKNHTKDIDQL